MRGNEASSNSRHGPARPGHDVVEAGHDRAMTWWRPGMTKWDGAPP